MTYEHKTPYMLKCVYCGKPVRFSVRSGRSTRCPCRKKKKESSPANKDVGPSISLEAELTSWTNYRREKERERKKSRRKHSS